MLFPTAITGLLVAGYILMRLYDAFVTPIARDPYRLFHITTEGGVVAWWNSTLLLGIAGFALLLATLSGPGRPAPGRIGRASWLTVAAAAGYLSLDESVQLHERLGVPLQAMVDGGGEAFFTFAWVFPGAVLALVGCGFAMRWARRLPFDLRTGLFAAMATYVTGALGLEALNGWLKRQHADLAVQLGTLVEESMEMLGCLIALSTFAAALVLVREPSGKLTLALRPDLADPRGVLRYGRPGPYDAEGTDLSGIQTTTAAAASGPSASDPTASSVNASACPVPGSAISNSTGPNSTSPNSTVPGCGMSGSPGQSADQHLADLADLEDPEGAALRPDPHDDMR